MKGSVRTKLFIPKLVLVIAMLFAASFSFALPFNIVPKAGTALPTSWSPGQTLFAYYTVFNNTASTRNNNFVRSLPPNVSQITNGGTYGDTCGTNFNLGANGAANSSCTLQLTISGSVDASDPDAFHHLFVCFPGGKTCAGTNYPLNIANVDNSLLTIKVTPQTASINLGGTQQYKAIGNYQNGSAVDLTSTAAWNSSNTAVATISASGLASGSGIGNSQISASMSNVTSNSAILSVANPLVSIAITPSAPAVRLTSTQQFVATGTYQNGTTQNLTNMVTWVSSAPGIATINPTSGLATSAGTTFGSTTISATFAPNPGIVIPPTTLTISAFAYVSNVFNNNIVYCRISPTDGTLNNCTTTGDVTFSGPGAMVIDPTYKYVYIGGNNNGGTIYYCSINANGTLSNCQSSGCGANRISGITVNAATSTLWVSDSTGSTGQGIYYCPISATTGGIGGSNSPGGSQPQVYALAFNANDSVLFFGFSYYGYLYYGQMSGNSFSNFAQAVGTTIAVPGAIALNAAGTYAYVSNVNSNNIYQCTSNSSTTFSGCTTTSTQAGTTAIALSNDGSLAYIAYGQGYSSNTVNVCTINATTGAFGTCTVTGANFSSPRGLVVLYH